MSRDFVRALEALNLLGEPPLKLLPPLVLIGCSARKLTVPATARELYRGDLFRKSVTYAEGRGSPWYVLSAKHGLLAPDDMVEPYSVTLDGLSPQERKAWATEVFLQLRKRTSIDRPIMFLAGLRYREFLIQRLRAETTFPITSPLSQAGIGVQKAKLAAAIATGEPL